MILHPLFKFHRVFHLHFTDYWKWREIETWNLQDLNVIDFYRGMWASQLTEA